MAWSISERADAFTKDGQGKPQSPSKRFEDNLKAEERMKEWQRELRAKKA